MIRISRVIGLFAFLVWTAGSVPTAQGNAPPPRNYREPKGPQLVIQPTNENTARLFIPKNLVPPAPKAAADAGDFPGGTRTIVAGVAISAGIMLLGLQFARRRPGRGLAPLVLVGVALCTFVAATAFADALVPGQRDRPRDPAPRPADPPGAIRMPLVIEWGEAGNDVKLSISPDQLHAGGPPRDGPGNPNPAKNPPVGARPGNQPPPPPG